MMSGRNKKPMLSRSRKSENSVNNPVDNISSQSNELHSDKQNLNQHVRKSKNKLEKVRINESNNSVKNVYDFKSSRQLDLKNSTQRQGKLKNNQNLLDNYLSNVSKKTVDEGKIETKKKLHFGFKRLEELVDKDSSEILFVMSNRANGFLDLFQQNKEPDWIFLLMKISAKICSTEFIQSKTLLLTELTCYTFLNHLKTYILTTPTEKNSIRCMNMNLFFKDCLIVFESITTLFPKTAVERLKEIVVSSNMALIGIKNYCAKIKINETLITGMSDVLQKLNDIKLTNEMKVKEKSVFENVVQYLEPPENFRELTVYPTATDLESERPFLRPNIFKGAYHDVEHYLDVQFRLLREDFIAPLREGIQLYRDMINNKQSKKKKINNIHLYNDVIFEKKGEFVQDKNGYLINFNHKGKLRINWDMSKRFMFGSLLVFSVDKFKKFFLGVVLERKIELLKNGKLIVELLEDAMPLYDMSLTMVESKVFFEPYKCSMEVLKKINSHNFPMKKYIISAVNIIDYPYYIGTLPKLQYKIDELSEFNILINNQWPSKNQLKLDEMQYGAFKAALTQEFTIIQGPPGTGKTYIGLKIMKTIINNLYANHQPFLTKPILVVCYTNHALDQFMEGILDFTSQVVRIGGQSKSEKLENFSLRNIVQTVERSMPTNRGLRSVKDSVKKVMNKIKYFRKCAEVISYNAGVLELSLLKNGMPKKYHHCFENTLDLLSWLFQDSSYFNVDPVKFLDTVSHELINKVFHSEKLLEVKDNKRGEENDGDVQYEAYDFEHEQEDIVIYSLTLDDVKSTCKELLSECIELETLSKSDINIYNVYETTKFNFSIMENIHDYFEHMLSLVNVDVDLPRSIQELSELNMNQRWALYFQWVENTQEMFGPKITNYEQKYKHVYKQYVELRELENIEILKKMHVIALTTTGAARHRVMLEGLESPIVVVEEAAEVLEAHIVSSLTRHCQHLILIGDHKQLRPSNAVYKLAKDFNFDISLFERMVNNDVPCYTLGEQHRMRPEIASLISPIIYPLLKNHISVHNREHVRGVARDLFFLNHNTHENEVEETSSKSNEYEAKFLIMFARHLRLQGYRADEITILTTYSGQLFLLRSLRKQHPILEGMKITVVDNYQGEESDIILLSLVRSNENGNVGFLKTENRICVALSRAKYGMYIMGNMDNLYQSGDLWKQIKDTLVNQDSYGDELTLVCAVHSEITTKVSRSEDFSLIMEGGCTMLCKTLLLCGHYCASICHSYDREHMEIKCREPCNKHCDFDHPCLKLCYMHCGKCTVSVLKQLPCGHQLTLPCFVDNVNFPCEENVEVVLEDCGHKIVKKCHEKKPNCTYKCYDRLDCGHACERNCHKNDDPNHESYKCLKPCENINENCSLDHKCQKICYEDCSSCTIRINRKLPCGHNTMASCGLKNDEIKCNHPCDRLLICGHKCKSVCYEPCNPCDNQVKKIITVCGHVTKLKCHLIPEQKHCTQICERILDCGHKCKNLCAKPCEARICDELVLQKKGQLVCGHNEVWVLCCDQDKEFRMDSEYLLDKCREPCMQKLNCNDICLGTCGQCKQGRLHVPCNEICNKVNPCNHTCKSPCKERCPPCNQPCLYACNHSRCTKMCGVPCETCKEQCDWQCPHLKCTRMCSEICDRKPCYEPCKSKLECGHECIGFCGEPCPPLCRVCHKDEVTTIVFGYEDEPDARFVYLEDCKHTIESLALEQWMNQNDEEIALKQCPLCKTPVLKTLRFMNRVKIILDDLSKIKLKKFENSAVFESFERILKLLNNLNKDFDIAFIGDVNEFAHIKNLWQIFCEPLLTKVKRKRKKQGICSIPYKDTECIEYVINLFQSVCNYKIQIENIIDPHMKQTIINHFVWLLSVAFKFARQLSNQVIRDINMEMARGARILTLFEIKSLDHYKMAVGIQTPDALEVINLVNTMEALLMSCRPYSQSKDEEIEFLTQSIQQKIKGVAIISDEERKMIHKAMSVNFFDGIRAQGHWCKCSNGHIYCVTECGGPMQKSVCPECKVEIGGQNHRHASGVHVATEMDGATNLLWNGP